MLAESDWLSHRNSPVLPVNSGAVKLSVLPLPRPRNGRLFAAIPECGGNLTPVRHAMRAKALAVERNNNNHENKLLTAHMAACS
jgi:hypothetical protein